MLSGCSGNTKSSLENCADINYKSNEIHNFENNVKTYYEIQILGAFEKICRRIHQHSGNEELLAKVNRCSVTNVCSSTDFQEINKMISKSYRIRADEYYKQQVEREKGQWHKHLVRVIRRSSYCRGGLRGEAERIHFETLRLNFHYAYEEIAQSRIKTILDFPLARKAQLSSYEKNLLACESSQRKSPKTFDAKWSNMLQ